MNARRRRVGRLALGLACALGWSAAQAEAQGLELALLLDTSGSIGARGAQQRQGVVEVVLGALPSGTAITLFAFDDAPRLVAPRTTDTAAIAQAAAGLTNQGQYTALNDAVFDAARTLAAGPAGKRAILVVSDGYDENSALIPEDGVNEARRNRIPIFAIGIANVRERPLRRIAKLSGGDYFAPGSSASDVVARIGEATPVSTAAVAPPAAATAAVPVPAPAAAEPAAGRVAPEPAFGQWAVGLVVATVALAALAGVAFVFMRKAPPPSAEPEFRVDEEVEDSTLIARREDLEQADSTLVLTLKPLLHVTRGPNFGRFFEVKLESATSIGRAKGNDVVLEDRAVSSQHCRVRRAESGLYEVVDLRSTNGTYVNERRVSRATLAAGDVIKVGESHLQFRMDHLKG
jgi:hypothetical protein